MKVEIELPDLPPGYEYTGEYRQARKGETFMICGVLRLWREEDVSESPFIILRRKPNEEEDEEVGK